MTTARDIITLALKNAGVNGVGQTPSAEDTNDALRLLNMMIGQWNKKRWLVYHLLDSSVTTTGAQTYTVGSGGNFNIARPDKLEAAFIRQINTSPTNPVQWSLGIVESREDYSRISLPSLSSAPSQCIYYDADWPLGTVYPWPIPPSGWELHIITKAALPGFATLDTAYDLPPEYEEAIYYNLSLRLAGPYQLPIRPDVQALARASLNTIRVANTQIATSVMPAGLGGGSRYNIYSDGYSR